MKKIVTIETLRSMCFGECVHSDLDLTTYIIRCRDGFAVCDNGEQVIVPTASAAISVMIENAGEQNV